jgi:D-alanyl-D-alanine carboxypeptidase
MHYHLASLSLLLAAVLALGACQPAPAPVAEQLADHLQTLVEETVSADELVPAAALHVEAPRLGLSWGGATGLADPAAETPMTARHPVRIASNTKTFVAAAILRLWEDQRLGLDDPISKHLSAEHVELLRSDGYQPEQITVRNLLTHTSGIFDHTTSDSFFDRIVAEPGHRWTRAEQVEAAVDWGDPHGPPAQEFRYCDTGYVLLGEILERVSGQPMAVALRDLLGFERLGLGSTWLETMEPRPAGVPEIAHQLTGEIDGFTIDPSIDLYGGGGLAMTMGDLARFMQALFTGHVLNDPETLSEMLTTIQTAADKSGTARSLDYRMGIWIDEIDGTMVYRHTGYWGTAASYAPTLDVVVAATVNQHKAKESLVKLESQALSIIREAAGS